MDAFEGFFFSKGGVPQFLYPCPVYIHTEGGHSSPQISETEKLNFVISKLKTQLCKFFCVFGFTQQSSIRSLYADFNTFLHYKIVTVFTCKC